MELANTYQSLVLFLLKGSEIHWRLHPKWGIARLWKHSYHNQFDFSSDNTVQTRSKVWFHDESLQVLLFLVVMAFIERLNSVHFLYFVINLGILYVTLFMLVNMTQWYSVEVALRQPFINSFMHSIWRGHQ